MITNPKGVGKAMKKLMVIVMSALSAPAEFRPGEKIILKGYTVKNAVGQNIKDNAIQPTNYKKVLA